MRSPSEKNKNKPTAPLTIAERAVLELVTRHSGYTWPELVYIASKSTHRLLPAARQEHLLFSLEKKNCLIRGPARQCGRTRQRRETWHPA